MLLAGTFSLAIIFSLFRSLLSQSRTLFFYVARLNLMTNWQRERKPQFFPRYKCVECSLDCFWIDIRMIKCGNFDGDIYNSINFPYSFLQSIENDIRAKNHNVHASWSISGGADLYRMDKMKLRKLGQLFHLKGWIFRFFFLLCFRWRVLLM